MSKKYKKKFGIAGFLQGMVNKKRRHGDTRRAFIIHKGYNSH